MKSVRTIIVMLTIAVAGEAWGAIGCTLSNPAQDLKYLFPEMTSYKEELREFNRLPNGHALYQHLRERLGKDLDPIYETIDTPYTLYRVFKGKTLIGIVHGVNVPGQGGVIQVFLSTDPQTNVIRKMFFQRLESPAARALRDKAFRQQFEGLTPADFEAGQRASSLPPPAVGTKGMPDYQASLRGIHKNLILLDMFIYKTEGGSK